MKPETALFMDKAQELLERGETMMKVDLHEDAGRAAYLAAFHAAQALIFEHRNKAVKTHGGVQTEFLPITKEDARVDPGLRAFLGRAYNLKAIADYETDPGPRVSKEASREALQIAHRFVERVMTLLPPRTAASGQ